MDSGWSLKHLHRLIVDLGDLPPVVARDAGAAGAGPVQPPAGARPAVPRRRRDRPRHRPGGQRPARTRRSAAPSVFPPAPAFLFQPPASYGPKVWTEATGPDRYRRALYTFRYRSVPYPMLQTFDAPNGDFSCVRRAASNTPLQALTLLNEPVFLECARALAAADAEARAGRPTPTAWRYAFRRCLARSPRREESQPLLELLDQRDEAVRRPGRPNPWDLAVGKPEEALALPPTPRPPSSPAGRSSPASC